jgi:hypothetical protein
MLIFFARKTENRPVKIGLALLACPAAAAAALLIRSDLFSWQGIPMALLPLLALHTGIYLEKRDDRNRAGKILDRLGYLLAFLLLTALGILLYAPVCRHFGFTCPEVLKFYPSGRSLLRPALALLVPLLWLFMGKKAEKMADKLLCIAAGAAFVMLALPPALPWTHLLHDIPGTAVTAIAGEIKSNVPAYFADRDSAGVLIYELQIPVQTIGRREGELHPGELKKQLENILRERDVVIALSNKDMDSYLPQIGGIVYTSGSNRRIIRYSGGKK